MDARDPQFGLTPLHIAAIERNHSALRTLIAAGANPLIGAASGRLPLELLQAATPEQARQDPAYLQLCEALEKAGEMAQAREAQAREAQASAARIPAEHRPRAPRAGAATRPRSSSV